MGTLRDDVNEMADEGLIAFLFKRLIRKLFGCACRGQRPVATPSEPDGRPGTRGSKGGCAPK
jgi:hypothetical protein